MDVGLPLSTLPRAAERRLLPAAAILWLERAWAGSLRWPALAWAGFALLALLGAWEQVGSGFRVGLLFLLALGTLVALGHAIVTTPVTERAAILRRLEQASRLRRGSLALLDERPVDLSDPVAARLWARARDEAQPRRLRLGIPRLVLLPEDRKGLAPLVLLLAFALAFAVAGTSWRDRLSNAFSPFQTSLAGTRIILTVTPPAYVGRPAEVLQMEAGRTLPLTALAGSRLDLRVEGPAGDWELETPDHMALPLANGRTSFALKHPGSFILHYGWRQAARLDVKLAADGAPVVGFAGAPSVTATGALRIGYRLEDDHGSSALMLELRLGGETRRIMLDPAVRPGTGASFVDLTPDPFAGEAVQMRLLARDGAGQVGHSQVKRLVLPERQFNHPVAREIIAARKQLLRSPAQRDAVAERLTQIASRPERFDEDLAVFAGLRAANWRLAYDRSDPMARSVARLLWDIAVDLDDRGASRAMEDLRRKMDELARRMGSANDEELARLADQLNAAMAEYLRRQLESMLQAGMTPEMAADAAANQMVDLSFLDQMLSDLRDRLAAGDMAGAQAALQNLRQLMENIRFTGSGSGDPEAARRAQQAAAAAEGLRDLEARERDLQGQTIAEGVRRAIGGERGSTEQLAGEQGKLERQAAAVEEQMQGAGMQTPGALGEAKQAMAEARQALASGDTAQAAVAQGRAVEALGRAAQEASSQAQAMAQAAGGMPGQIMPGAAGSGIDPLGRPGSGFGQGLVKLPDGSQAKRVAAIRRLLEERASDPNRSAEERAYYLRLLKRF